MPRWIILGTLLICSRCGDRLTGTTFISLKCGSTNQSKHYQWPRASAHNRGNANRFATPEEENVSESSPATAATNAVISSSNPALVAWPTVAQKEPQNCALYKQAVGSTVGIGACHKPTQLDSPGSATPLHGNRGRSPIPGRIRTRSLNNTHCMQRPFPRWILRLLRNMVPAHLRKVTLTIIKGDYHERFAATHCTDFDYSQIMAQAFHRKRIGLGSVYKARLDICIFCFFPNKTCL